VPSRLDVRNRVAPTAHVGVALALLVAVAVAAAAWLLFARAENRARADDDRAAESAFEALQNGPGGVIASLRGADALPDADGRVAPERFAAFASAVAPSPSQPIALVDVAPAAGRAAVEARLGRPFRDVTPSGDVRSARARASYVSVVAVWPATIANRARGSTPSRRTASSSPSRRLPRTRSSTATARTAPAS
jgi:hypothetical protein